MRTAGFASVLAAFVAGCAVQPLGDDESNDHCIHEGGDPLCDPDSQWCADDSHCDESETCRDSECVPWGDDDAGDDGQDEDATCGNGVLETGEQCEPSEGDPLCRQDCLLRGELVGEFSLDEPVAIDALRGDPSYFAILSNTETGVAVDTFQPGGAIDDLQGFEFSESQGWLGLDVAVGRNAQGFPVVAALMTDGVSESVRTMELNSGMGMTYELPDSAEPTRLVDSELGFAAARQSGEVMLLTSEGQVETLEQVQSDWLDLGAFAGGLALLDGEGVTRLDPQGIELDSFPGGVSEPTELVGLAATGGRLTLSARDSNLPAQTLLRDFTPDGEQIWEFSATGDIHRAFAWNGEHTLVGSPDPGVLIVQLDATDGVLWSVEESSSQYTDATVTERHVGIVLEDSVRFYAR